MSINGYLNTFRTKKHKIYIWITSTTDEMVIQQELCPNGCVQLSPKFKGTF
jgi:hypothetical protein